MTLSANGLHAQVRAAFIFGRTLAGTASATAAVNEHRTGYYSYTSSTRLAVTGRAGPHFCVARPRGGRDSVRIMRYVHCNRSTHGLARRVTIDRDSNHRRSDIG
jgi:hypothetical protein